MFKKKNVLVTGGLGFIGSHIVNEIIDNNNVTIIDDKSTGKIDNLNDYNHSNLFLIDRDLKEIDLNNLLVDVDYVFHLAGMVNVTESINNPVKCNECNVNNTVKLLEACRINDIEKIVFSSSSAVYGNNENTPLKEEEYPLPMSPYASSKISCEMYLKSYFESYGIKYVGLRYFNVFGERQNINGSYAAVIPNIICKILNNEKPIIYGDGNQSRDFVYIKDVVNANIKAIESEYNGIINVASGSNLTINDLCSMICKMMNYEGGIEYLPIRKGEIRHSLGDNSKMKRINCKISSNDFEKNLEKTIEWIKRNK